MGYGRLRRRPEGIPVLDEETGGTKMLTLPKVLPQELPPPTPQRTVFYGGKFMTYEEFQKEREKPLTLFRGRYLTDEEIEQEILADRH